MNKVIKQKDKQKEFEHLFNSVRMWMNIDSQHNQYDDTVLFYALDNGGFYKRSERNPKPLWNWVVLNHDKYQMRYLKYELNLRNKDDLNFQGRMTPVGRIKDDLFFETVKFIKDIFNPWFDEHVEKETSATEPYKTTKLF